MILELLFRTPLAASERIRLVAGMKNIIWALREPRGESGMSDPQASDTKDQPDSVQTIHPASEVMYREDTLDIRPFQKMEKGQLPLKTRAVPATKTNRLINYVGLAVGMTAGAFSEKTKRIFRGGDDQASSPWLSMGNSNRIVERLSKMRGAALKLGQIFSMQDTELLPPHVSSIFDRVRNMAYAMPWSQADKVLAENLGSAWRDRFLGFEEQIPVAAASIGQVHRASIDDGRKVAVKIQYPGVRQSLSSDIASLRALLIFGNILPKGLFLENTLRVLEKELLWETDYLREASWMEWFRRELPKLSSVVDGAYPLKVPQTFPSLSGPSVLTTEWVDGVTLDQVSRDKYPQSVRDRVERIGTTLLALCFWEIFVLKAMQTDPNWSNFFFDGRQITLLDFGASRSFDPVFVKQYRRLVLAAARKDRDEGYKASLDLKYLTGLESKTMIDAHLTSLMSIGLPFHNPQGSAFDFATYSTVVKTMKTSIPVMLEERLTPPPEDTYSLHRKLSGVFLLCAKIGAKVDCNALLTKLVEHHRILDLSSHPLN